MAENPYWWTHGFWPGILWLMFHHTGEAAYRETAEEIEKRLDDSLAGYEGLHHDVGFMWLPSSGLDYRLTGNPLSKTRTLHAAGILAGRYNPRGHFLRAWNGKYTGWMIVDSMMNLPLLYWASEELDDPRFKFIAMEHADTALKYLVREDGSCNHIAILDPADGSFVEAPAGQGYAPGSSWTRGQAWALYGFALSYLHTGEARYLEASRRIAGYFSAEVSRYGYVPPVDFRAPAEPKKIDTSAGAIAACGLLCLGDCIKTAMHILTALESGYGDWNTDRDAVLQMGTAQYHDKLDEFHVPLIYGDYFFIEAVHRLTSPDFNVW
jgi:unsaturated chondroitin disaccharide hydrolase